MPPKKSFEKKLMLSCEDEDPLEKSIYSEIGKDGLLFLKNDLKIGLDGI